MMAMMIVAAKSLIDVREIMKGTRKTRDYIVEVEGLQAFCFEYRTVLAHCELYRRFEPDGPNLIECNDLEDSCLFAKSVKEFIDTHQEMENTWIDRFNLSISKLKKYAIN